MIKARHFKQEYLLFCFFVSKTFEWNQRFDTFLTEKLGHSFSPNLLLQKWTSFVVQILQCWLKSYFICVTLMREL